MLPHYLGKLKSFEFAANIKQTAKRHTHGSHLLTYYLLTSVYGVC